MTQAPDLERARAFLSTHARILERRLFEVAFEGASPVGVLHALRAYQNSDGGFGHALEPDLRAPGSQPLFVHSACSALREAGLPGGAEIERACAWLATVADDSGALPYALPDALEHERANHWQGGDYGYAPSLHATAGVLGGLHALDAQHEWIEHATRWCLAQIASDPDYTGHRMRNVLDLLENLPSTYDATGLRKRVSDRLFEADYVLLQTPVASYGLTPLHFAPTPDSPLRAHFTDAQIEAHLDDLAARQQEDGGWPIHWTPPPGAATNEWRGRWTLEALRVLRAYGRLG